MTDFTIKNVHIADDNTVNAVVEFPKGKWTYSYNGDSIDLGGRRLALYGVPIADVLVEAIKGFKVSVAPRCKTRFITNGESIPAELEWSDLKRSTSADVTLQTLRVSVKASKEMGLDRETAEGLAIRTYPQHTEIVPEIISEFFGDEPEPAKPVTKLRKKGKK